MPILPACSRAVPGISCIIPRAPAWLTAARSNELSWRVMPWASDHMRAPFTARGGAGRRSRRRRRCPFTRAMRATQTPRSCAADLLAELRGEHALGVVVERFRQCADEQGLFVPATLLASDLRRLDEPPRREFRPLCRIDREGRQRPRRRDGASELLERQLAVEQLRIGRRALEIGDARR